MKYDIAELLPIVESLTRKYTRNENTSISYAAAQQLMEAVLYCMEEREASSILPAAPLSAPDAYALGYEAVLRKTKETMAQYNALMERFSSYGNRAYEETIAQGFPAFFRWYDPLFAPQEHLLTLDYPVLYPLEALCGIDRIAAYLECIILEQEFLHFFHQEFISSALAQHHPDWKGLFINLPYFVLKKLLCLLLLHTSVGKEYDDDALRRLLKGLSKDRLQERLSSLLHQFLMQYFPENKALEAYLQGAIPDIATELRAESDGDCFSHTI